MKVQVPGATIHWQSHGEGPVLLVIQGGDGDADASSMLVDRLKGFTVITYDRRGLTRSTIEGDPKTNVELHAEDALAVLDAATKEPAFIFGTSIGALIGLELTGRWPARVRRLVAHEPPVTELLPPDKKADVDRARTEINDLFKTKGVLPAMRRFFAGTGIDFLDREPEVGFPPANPSRMNNLRFFLAHDAGAAWDYRIDLQRLKQVSDRLVIAAGVNTRGFWLHRCSAELAERLGLPLVDFPGGHAAYAAHPRGVAEVLTRLFSQ